VPLYVVRVPLPVEGCRYLSSGTTGCCGVNPEVLLCMLCPSQPWGALSISAVGVSFVKVWGFVLIP
jgi:hypothetical protein